MRFASSNLRECSSERCLVFPPCLPLLCPAGSCWFVPSARYTLLSQCCPMETAHSSGTQQSTPSHHFHLLFVATSCLPIVTTCVQRRCGWVCGGGGSEDHLTRLVNLLLAQRPQAGGAEAAAVVRGGRGPAALSGGHGAGLLWEGELLAPVFEGGGGRSEGGGAH